MPVDWRKHGAYRIRDPGRNLLGVLLENPFDEIRSLYYGLVQEQYKLKLNILINLACVLSQCDNEIHSVPWYIHIIAKIHRNSPRMDSFALKIWNILHWTSCVSKLYGTLVYLCPWFALCGVCYAFSMVDLTHSLPLCFNETLGQQPQDNSGVSQATLIITDKHELWYEMTLFSIVMLLFNWEILMMMIIILMKMKMIWWLW